MADSPKLRKTILKEVLRDNLSEVSGVRPRYKRRGSQKFYGWLGALVLLPGLLGLSGYLFAFSPQQAENPESVTRTVYTGKIPSPELFFPSVSLQEILAFAEGEENLPRNYSALAGTGMTIAELFDLGVKTIVIDPGHGGRDPGAIGPGGLMEKDVTLDVARRLRDRLQRYPGYRILMTRDADVWVSLRDRVHFANVNQADLFISIHVNAIETSEINIIETYYFGAQAADEQALRLAAVENRGSEYLMAEFRGMIQKIGDTFKQQESQLLAAAIQENLYRHVREESGYSMSRGIKTAPFIVLLGAEMPSVLAEITCISNPEEERKLADPQRREQFASYLEGGIVNYLNRSHPEHNPDGGINAYVGEKTNGKG
jgi:N-acetylmuramoyl-L-alanine amidase